MSRNALRGLLLCVAPALLAGGLVGGGVYAVNAKTPTGGTVLVYQAKGDDPPAEAMARLTDQLKERLDPQGANGVIVRATGPNRVEVVVPEFAGGTGTDIEDVRQQVRQAGLLEFRILANGNDDAEAISDTQKVLNLPGEQEQKLLRKAAEEGLPPLAPTGEYPVKAAGDEIVPVRYEWAELGWEERESLGLNERYAGVGKEFTTRYGETHTTHFFDEVAKTRGKTYPPTASSAEGGLYYSRESLTRKPDGPGPAVDYFLLTRVSDQDSLRADGVQAKLTASFRPTTAGNRGPAVGFEFVKGGNRFYEMTKRNKPSGFERQLAIIMDGKIVSAPTLHDALNGGGEISGNFDARSANQLVSLLRSGNLAVELKPDPVSEGGLDPATADVVKANSGRSALTPGLIAGGIAFVVVLLTAGVVFFLLLPPPHPRAA